MKLNRILSAVFFNLLSALGSTLAILGVIFSGWFFFASESTARFYLGIGAIFLTCIGYFIYRFAFLKNHKKWTDRY